MKLQSVPQMLNLCRGKQFDSKLNEVVNTVTFQSLAAKPLTGFHGNHFPFIFFIGIL
jgi:hypothetical protein